jgi:hypothetical protein
MRRLLGAVLLGSVLVLTACGGGDDESGGRVALLAHVQQEVERNGAPKPVAECIVRELDKRLDIPELEAAYDKLPENPTDAEVAQILRKTWLDEATAIAVKACAGSLLPQGRKQAPKPDDSELRTE